MIRGMAVATIVASTADMNIAMMTHTSTKRRLVDNERTCVIQTPFAEKSHSSEHDRSTRAKLKLSTHAPHPISQVA
jgi:hypothetical protein